MKNKTYCLRITTFFCLPLLLWSIGNSAVLAFDAKPCPVPTIPFPPTATASDELRFAAIGDTGETCQDKPKKCQLIEKMLEVRNKTNFNQLFFLGDNVYTFGNPKGLPEKLYEPYRRLAENGVFLRGVIGNHDVYNAKGGEIQIKFFRSENLTAQMKFFSATVNEQLLLPPVINETYYTQTEKPQLIEFFALDSNLLSANKSKKKGYPKNTREEPIKWLETELKRSKDAGTKWRIILIHHPLYSSAKKHGVKKVNEDGSDRKIHKKMKLMREIEPLLEKFNVKLVLAGHDHTYERIEPQKGIYHFVSGAGAKLRTKDFNRKRLPNYHACGKADELSFMLFSVKLDSLTFWTIGENGLPFDAGIIHFN